MQADSCQLLCQLEDYAKTWTTRSLSCVSSHLVATISQIYHSASQHSSTRTTKHRTQDTQLYVSYFTNKQAPSTRHKSHTHQKQKTQDTQHNNHHVSSHRSDTRHTKFKTSLCFTTCTTICTTQHVLPNANHQPCRKTTTVWKTRNIMPFVMISNHELKAPPHPLPLTSGLLAKLPACVHASLQPAMPACMLPCLEPAMLACLPACQLCLLAQKPA